MARDPLAPCTCAAQLQPHDRLPNVCPARDDIDRYYDAEADPPDGRNYEEEPWR